MEIKERMTEHREREYLLNAEIASIDTKLENVPSEKVIKRKADLLFCPTPRVCWAQLTLNQMRNPAYIWRGPEPKSKCFETSLVFYLPSNKIWHPKSRFGIFTLTVHFVIFIPWSSIIPSVTFLILNKFHFMVSTWQFPTAIAIKDYSIRKQQSTRDYYGKSIRDQKAKPGFSGRKIYPATHSALISAHPLPHRRYFWNQIPTRFSSICDSTWRFSTMRGLADFSNFKPVHIFSHYKRRTLWRKTILRRWNISVLYEWKCSTIRGSRPSDSFLKCRWKSWSR